MSKGRTSSIQDTPPLKKRCAHSWLVMVVAPTLHAQGWWRSSNLRPWFTLTPTPFNGLTKVKATKLTLDALFL